LNGVTLKTSNILCHALPEEDLGGDSGFFDNNNKERKFGVLPKDSHKKYLTSEFGLTFD